jgi:hypothetical protein
MDLGPAEVDPAVLLLGDDDNAGDEAREDLWISSSP